MIETMLKIAIFHLELFIISRTIEILLKLFTFFLRLMKLCMRRFIKLLLFCPEKQITYRYDFAQNFQNCCPPCEDRVYVVSTTSYVKGL